jgi:hypothetical protein
MPTTEAMRAKAATDYVRYNDYSDADPNGLTTTPFAITRDQLLTAANEAGGWMHFATELARSLKPAEVQVQVADPRMKLSDYVESDILAIGPTSSPIRISNMSLQDRTAYRMGLDRALRAHSDTPGYGGVEGFTHWLDNSLIMENEGNTFDTAPTPATREKRTALSLYTSFVVRRLTLPTIEFVTRMTEAGYRLQDARDRRNTGDVFRPTGDLPLLPLRRGN